jgi:hypothetical protein
VKSEGCGGEKDVPEKRVSEKVGFPYRFLILIVRCIPEPRKPLYCLYSDLKHHGCLEAEQS